MAATEQDGGGGVLDAQTPREREAAVGVGFVSLSLIHELNHRRNATDLAHHLVWLLDAGQSDVEL